MLRGLDLIEIPDDLNSDPLLANFFVGSCSFFVLQRAQWNRATKDSESGRQLNRIHKQNSPKTIRKLPEKAMEMTKNQRLLLAISANQFIYHIENKGYLCFFDKNALTPPPFIP